MSLRSTRRGRRRNKKQEWENAREGNETSENALNDIEMEYRDVVDKKIEAVQEWDKKQEIFGHRQMKERLKNDHKTEDINSVRLNGENSCSTSPNNIKRGASLKIKVDLSNGNSKNVNDDICSMEEDTFHRSCIEKRKRDCCECDSYNSKFQGSGLTCIGILPGLKSIIESSDDSDQSCSSDSEGNENNKYDLLGRKIVCVAKKSSESK